MKFLILISVALLLSITKGFAPTTRVTPKSRVVLQAESNDDSIVSRRDAFGKGTNAMMVSFAAASIMACPEQAIADIYDEQEKERKRKQKEDAENARKLVPAVLFGGTALSVPFFFPNLVRLGKKFISLGKNDGYGGK